MKIISNEKIIQRNKKIGSFTTIASLVVLAGGLVMSFTVDYYTYSFLCLLLGFILSQVGIYYGSRWGRSPREDEKISAALKGLEDKYSLYHYTAFVPHLLVGPAGIWIILPYFQGGTITFDEKKGRWHQKGGSLYLKMFAQESLGRPDMDIKSYQEDALRFFQKNMSGKPIPQIQTVLVFTNPKVDVQAQNAPTPTVEVEKLKDFIRRMVKESPVSEDVYKPVIDMLPKPE